MRPCHCDRARPNEPFVQGQTCGRCWHWYNTTEIRVALGGPVEQPAYPVAKTQVIARAKLPCVHLGEKLPSQPCGSALHPCKFHGVITSKVGACKDAVRSCWTCRDYDDGTIKDPPPWHAESADFLQNLPPYPVGRWSGRGVVIAGGGAYWPSVYVTVRMLRHVGCTLPVQVWYMGSKNERDERYERLLEPFDVACIDADAHPARAARRIVNGFEVKLFAAINSPFEEVLFLDADNYPCVDPTMLFDDQRYIERGGIYWPDLPETNAWTRWPFWGVEKFGPDCGFETGQYLLHKRKAYEPMLLAEWYDDRSDYCYGPGTKGDHGDKGPHRVAWARLRREPVVFTTQAVWRQPAFVQSGPDGTPMFIHRTRGKFTLDAAHFKTTPQQTPNQRGGLPMESEAFSYLDELRASL